MAATRHFPKSQVLTVSTQQNSREWVGEDPACPKDLRQIAFCQGIREKGLDSDANRKMRELRGLALSHLST